MVYLQRRLQDTASDFELNGLFHLEYERLLEELSCYSMVRCLRKLTERLQVSSTCLHEIVRDIEDKLMAASRP